jgi:hypothetical protein
MAVANNALVQTLDGGTLIQITIILPIKNGIPATMNVI